MGVTLWTDTNSRSSYRCFLLDCAAAPEVAFKIQFLVKSSASVDWAKVIHVCRIIWILLRTYFFLTLVVKYLNSGSLSLWLRYLAVGWGLCFPVSGQSYTLWIIVRRREEVMCWALIWYSDSGWGEHCLTCHFKTLQDFQLGCDLVTGRSFLFTSSWSCRQTFQWPLLTCVEASVSSLPSFYSASYSISSPSCVSRLGLCVDQSWGSSGFKYVVKLVNVRFYACRISLSCLLQLVKLIKFINWLDNHRICAYTKLFT